MCFHAAREAQVDKNDGRRDSMLRRTMALLLAAALLPGCGRESDEPVEGATPSLLERNDFAGDAAFVLIRGTDTLAVERYSASESELEGQILDADGARMRYRVRIGEDGRIERMELEAYEEGSAEPLQTAVAEIRGDSLIAEVREGGEVTDVQRLGLPRGTFVHLGPSIATLEHLLRRAKEMDEERVEMPVFVAGRSRDSEFEPVERVSITWIGADSVHAVLDRENQFMGAVESNGSIRHGMNPAQGVRVERVQR
jgi:hypothetical protein